MIRTGGEQRISNFLLWHVAYAELYFQPGAVAGIQCGRARDGTDLFSPAASGALVSRKEQLPERAVGEAMKVREP